MSTFSNTGYSDDLEGIARQALESARDLEFYVDQLETRTEQHSRKTKALLTFYTDAALEIIKRLPTD